ncbi:M48 family metallopeptidase [Pseudothauera nasutitermitis]|uniref:M48 family metallopeptidase n=1 Tax=Pseudothauera nasutitermitis TaxID=2565930 RepID=A0A4S4AZL9_9RHOO|nr:M48 family metallopeptidase [Pseudothauera nasutitermitis]
MLRRKPPAPTEECREALLQGRAVPYTLRRSARRTLALQVEARGVRVSAPHACAQKEIDRFLAAHARWLFDKLDALAARPRPAAFAVHDGALFPLLGRDCRLRLEESARRVRWRVAADGGDELLLPAQGDGAALLERALRRRALDWYAGRVEEYCHRLGLPPPAVRLTSARTRWGSCSRHGGIRLHWRLIHLPAELIDYVVAHEVAHLLEMNHSARFWSLVESLYPDWRAARARLREAGAGLPNIGGADVSVPNLHEE